MCRGGSGRHGGGGGQEPADAPEDRRWGYISVVEFGEGPEVRHWLVADGSNSFKDANFIKKQWR